MINTGPDCITAPVSSQANISLTAVNVFPLSDVTRYGGPALTSLELVDYPETILPENALRSLTSLRSLTVRYRYIREGVECRLRSWLSPLQQLETLAIVGQSPSLIISVTYRVMS